MQEGDLVSYQRDRDEFLTLATREGLTLDQARALLRYASTIERLAVAQCNGDWPADNGERPTVECPRCGQYWHRSSMTMDHKAERDPARPRYVPLRCPDCRQEDLVRATLPDGYSPVFSGDPRGCTLKIKVPSGYTNDWGKEGLCVPARER